jgi:hypothetical protein
VLLYIYLHTLGYQKCEDSLTYNQIVGGIKTRNGKQLDKGAGVSRRSLVEALSGLEKKGYIKRTGANSASSKISLRFDAPEFQNSVEETNKQVEEQQEQKIHLLPVQKLHPSYNNHALKHDDEKIGNSTDKPNQELLSVYKPSINYLLQNIPNLSESDAKQLVYIAILEHGRNQDYLQQLTQYVLTNPRIHTPAAVLTKLVKNNSERVIPIARANKLIQIRDSKKETNDNAKQHLTFPVASKYIAQSNPPLEDGADNSRGSVLTLSVGARSRKFKNKSIATQEKPLLAEFTQSTFDWNNLDKPGTQNDEVTDLALPVSCVTGVASETESNQAITSVPKCNLVEAMQRLRDDAEGRLRYSTSRQLLDLLQKARLEIGQDSGKYFIQLKFDNELSERLLTQQDYYVVRLSLRQSIGMGYVIKIGENNKESPVIEQSWLVTEQAS